MESVNLRPAVENDIPFLVDTIIESEKSGTEVLSYETVFGISEPELRQYLTEILVMGEDGCELSLSSFWIAEVDKKIIGSVSCWKEGSQGVSSSWIKGNLLGMVLPEESLQIAKGRIDTISELYIKYPDDAFIIGLVYVSMDYRGMRLTSRMIDYVLEKLKPQYPNTKRVFIQVFGNNIPAIKAYERTDFSIMEEKKSEKSEIMDLLPYHTKVMMIRKLN